ncbi:MAG: squalene--hopene cyclase [Gemmatimonadota bacterium]
MRESGAARQVEGPARDLLEEVAEAVVFSRDYLLSLQEADGHWCGELEADTVLESEYIILLYFLGRAGEERAAKAGEYIRRHQLPEGGWAIYRGGPAELSASVKAYFVLKLLGDDPRAPHMTKAQRKILELGGVEAVNTYTKIYLAIFGQYDWDRCPAILPEMMLLPGWFYLNVNEMSSWSRGIFVPLSIIWAHRPIVRVPESASIGELYVDGSRPQHPALEGAGRWETVAHRLFHGVDWSLKLAERSRFKPLRRRAIKTAESWILHRLEESDGLGAIFPAMINTIMALRCLGYPADHPLILGQLEALEKHEVDLGDALRVQPALSPVWDTAQAVNALVVAGLEPDHPAVLRAAEWLVDREVRRPGDWLHKNPGGNVGGWYFEYANEFYPDCDDTAKVLTSLTRVRVPDPELRARVEGARSRGLRWLLSMQNPDGGWAAFDRECDKEVFTLVPFADHNAMIDPSWEDITGRVLETLALEGFAPTHLAVQRAVRFIQGRQHGDGTWYGRWGCNYIYGTWLALWGLHCAGVDLRQERYQKAARWLRDHQNSDGGWGESLGSYEDPALKGRGPSTASQSAWALLALFATGDYESEAVLRGVRHLLETQRNDGSWDDEHWTGTGFPRVFYLRYHLYDDYFPLLALGTFLRGRKAVPSRVEGATEPRLSSNLGPE